MDLITEIIERAKANKQRIVLPEGTEERTLKAANLVLTEGIADLILLGNPEEIKNLAKEWGLGNIHKATIIDPDLYPHFAIIMARQSGVERKVATISLSLVIAPEQVSIDAVIGQRRMHGNRHHTAILH